MNKVNCGTEQIALSVYPKACSDLELHTMCAGCSRIKWDQICTTYLEPRKHWGIFKACSFHPSRAKERVVDEKQLTTPRVHSKASKKQAGKK